MSDVEAAASNIAFGTAWHMLVTRAKLRRGRDGARQLRRQRDRLGGRPGREARGRVRDRDLEPRRQAGEGERSSGSTSAINYTTQDVVEEVLRVTDGHGVDVVYEHVGGELFQAGLDSLAKDGRLVICGAHAGEVVDFDIIPFFRRQLQVIGSFVFDRYEVEKCFDLIGRGALKPQVAATFPLEEAAQAMELMESREFFGKIVLTAGGGA